MTRQQDRFTLMMQSTDGDLHPYAKRTIEGRMLRGAKEQGIDVEAYLVVNWDHPGLQPCEIVARFAKEEGPTDDALTLAWEEMYRLNYDNVKVFADKVRLKGGHQ